MQAARRELALEAAIRKLDKFHLIVLDDFSYVTKDQAETSVLFELISARYEQRSLLLTANQPFGQWDKIFPDPAMTVAAIDRLVHRATIFELNVESYRRRTAIGHKRSRQRGWLDNLPDNLLESALAHKLQAICALDLAELDSVEPPRGFGRD